MVEFAEYVKLTERPHKEQTAQLPPPEFGLTCPTTIAPQCGHFNTTGIMIIIIFMPYIMAVNNVDCIIYSIKESLKEFMNGVFNNSLKVKNLDLTIEC